jgi:hypothetical protein
MYARGLLNVEGRRQRLAGVDVATVSSLHFGTRSLCSLLDVIETPRTTGSLLPSASQREPEAGLALTQELAS